MEISNTVTGIQDSSRIEEDLIQRICNGEKTLFHDLIAPYRRVMFAAAYAVLRNPEDGEEAVQEAAFKTFLHLDQLQQRCRFKAWMLQIVVNEARMRRRHMRQHLYESLDEASETAERDALPRQFADWNDLPDEALERKELRDAVRKAVDSLPVIYREVYMLADAQRLSNAVIAEALGVSVGVVKTRLHRARLRIQEQLSPTFKPRFSDHIRLMKGMNPWSHARK